MSDQVKLLAVEYLFPVLAIFTFNYIKCKINDNKDNAGKVCAIIDTPLDIVFFSISYVIVAMAKGQNPFYGLIYFLVGIPVYMECDTIIRKEKDNFLTSSKVHILKVIGLYLFAIFTIYINIRILG